MPQFYKGDAFEMKMYNTMADIANVLSLQKTDFKVGAYSCYLLGDVLYDTNRAPLTKAIKKEIFRESYAAIFEAFAKAGTFEAYIFVFKAIFGDDVVTAFTVPAPGKLNISVTASGNALYNFITRYIDDNVYVTDEIIDWDGDNIVFQTVKGFESEYELQQMLFELVPDGIFTDITLTIV